MGEIYTSRFNTFVCSRYHWQWQRLTWLIFGFFVVASFADLEAVEATEAKIPPAKDLISLNKRSAMLLDRLMYNLKEIMKKQPNEASKDSGRDGIRFDRRAYRYVRGKVYTKCYMNAVSCF